MAAMVRRVLGAAPAWCDRLLDGAVLVTAAWTIAYHVSLLADLGAAAALGITVVVLGGWLAARWRLRTPALAVPASADVRLPELLRSGGAWVTLGAALVAAVSLAVDAPWVLVWGPWLVAAVAGTLTAVRFLARVPGPAADPEAEPGTAEPSSPWGALVALGWAVAMAVVSVTLVRANPDDLFYVNLSQWVADTGDFPLRDTVFSNLDFPISNWPPMASYDAGAGTLAWLAGIHAGTVVYVVVPPIVAFLSVLAMWRLLHAWRMPYATIALSLALVFLLLDSDPVSYGAPGTLFVTRLWQGKVILLCLLVPWLLTRLVRYADRPTRPGALWLLTGGVAAVGLTTTAMFLVPLIALAGAVPLLRDRRHALTAFATTALYPLGAGVVTTAVGGHSADAFEARKLYRFSGEWIAHAVFLDGFLAVVGVAAVLLGCLLIPHRAARVTSGISAAAFGVVLVPGVTELGYDLVGLGPTLWRLSWACTIAVLVGVLVVRLALLLRGRRSRNVAVVALLTGALLAVLGEPIWMQGRWRPPFQWQRSETEMALTARLLDDLPAGARILAPESLAITVAVTTTDVKTVAPRDYYMDYLEDEPRFHYEERLRLVRFINGTSGQHLETPASLRRALEKVPVDVACVPRTKPPRVHALEAVGMRQFLVTRDFRCLHPA